MADDENGEADRAWRVDGEEILAPSSPVREQIAVLLGEKRYEQALDLLYATRWQAPDSAEIPRSINLLKERLVRQYLKDLGNLDAVPEAAEGLDRASLSIGDEERSLLHLVDGISSFSDIAHQSRLGRFETYRALSRFAAEGVVVVPQPVVEVSISRHTTSRHTTTLRFSGPPLASAAAMLPPPTTRWRASRVGVAVLGVAAPIVAVWLAFDRLGQPPQTAVAVASDPANAAPAPVRRLELPLGEPSALAVPTPQPLSGARELAGASPPVRSSSTSVAPNGTRASRPGRKLVGRSSSRRPTTPAAAPASAKSSAPGGVAPPAAEEKGPPTPAELKAAAAPAPDQPTIAVRASADDDRSRSAQVAPAHALGKAPALPTKASAAPFAPAAVSVATNDIVVRGPLGRSVVEPAIARVEGDFRACYDTAAATLRRNAAGAARVQLTIDETGNAGAVSVRGGPLPGVDACLQEAARGIRTRVPPDVGPASVSFVIVFSMGGAAR